VRANQTDHSKEFVDGDGGAYLPANSFPAHRQAYLQWAVDFLKQVAARPPLHACFGMHEWAMLYRPTPEQIRHETPLRLPLERIAEVVDELGLRCTHYDAYRFFTTEATPKNRLALTRADTALNDQPGCVHVTMDLYKFAFKISPHIDASITADAFELAWQARYLDMKASPYDFSAYDLVPLKMETKQGREEYLHAKEQLRTQAEPIRHRLIVAYEAIFTPQELHPVPALQL
jgi:hypothetical protein